MLSKSIHQVIRDLNDLEGRLTAWSEPFHSRPTFGACACPKVLGDETGALKGILLAASVHRPAKAFSMAGTPTSFQRKTCFESPP